MHSRLDYSQYTGEVRAQINLVESQVESLFHLITELKESLTETEEDITNSKDLEWKAVEKLLIWEENQEVLWDDQSPEFYFKAQNQSDDIAELENAIKLQRKNTKNFVLQKTNIIQEINQIQIEKNTAINKLEELYHQHGKPQASLKTQPPEPVYLGSVLEKTIRHRRSYEDSSSDNEQDVYYLDETEWWAAQRKEKTQHQLAGLELTPNEHACIDITTEEDTCSFSSTKLIQQHDQVAQSPMITHAENDILDISKHTNSSGDNHSNASQSKAPVTPQKTQNKNKHKRSPLGLIEYADAPSSKRSRTTPQAHGEENNPGAYNSPYKNPRGLKAKIEVGESLICGPANQFQPLSRSKSFLSSLQELQKDIEAGPSAAIQSPMG